MDATLGPAQSSPYRPLPAEAAELLLRAGSPPRLLAHVTLVHDVAAQLVDRIQGTWPQLKLDRDAILFGAAIHDIGKAVERSELTRPGDKHPQRGLDLLIAMGVPRERARFALTHKHWREVPEVTLEDLVVALADKCWKGKRIPELEQRASEWISGMTGQPQWQAFALLDEMLTGLAEGGDERLAWQASFPVNRG